MSTEKSVRICPIENAGALEFQGRKWMHNPSKILKPYVREGMTALDLGCGPGFFTLEMARLVGKTGKVIAADLQAGMLEKLKNKLQGLEFRSRVALHPCQAEKIGLTEKVDFILIFYMLHEVPNPPAFLAEIASLLKPAAKVLIVEPKFHVSKKDFEASTQLMRAAGLEITEKPKVFFSRAVILEKSSRERRP
jgi:ubiquinone/menaquinone biosynthesis C-methylase UbiE